MKQNMKMIVSVWLISLFAFLLPITNVDAATVDHAVTISAMDNKDDKLIIEPTVVTFKEGDTAWDILEEAADHIDYETSDYGPMIEGINGVEADFDEEGTFWSFATNGQYAAVGASDYEVAHGDHLAFHLTDDMETMEVVTLSIVGEDGDDITDTKKVEVIPNATVQDVLMTYASIEEQSVDLAVDDTYGTFIDNIFDIKQSPDDWWEVGLNDSPLETAAFATRIQTDDHVSFILQSMSDESAAEGNEGTESETAEADKTTKDISTLSVDVKEEIEELIKLVDKHDLVEGYGDEWWVWALGVAHQDIPESYLSDVKAKLKDNKGEFDTITDLERVIIALGKMSEDVTSIKGINLIDELMSHPQLESAPINGKIFALIALNSGKYKIDEQIEQKIVDEIVATSLSGGGWSYDGDLADPDMTGMALMALGAYTDQPEVETVIDEAVQYLQSIQDESGGFPLSNGDLTSLSTAQVILGLLAVDIDPLSDVFITESSQSPLSHLLSYKNEEGFYHINYDTLSENIDHGQLLMSTAQAFLALAAYDQYSEQEQEEEKDSSLPLGGIIGGVIGLLVLIGLFLWLKRKKA